MYPLYIATKKKGFINANRWMLYPDTKFVSHRKRLPVQNRLFSSVLFCSSSVLLLFFFCYSSVLLLFFFCSVLFSSFLFSLFSSLPNVTFSGSGQNGKVVAPPPSLSLRCHTFFSRENRARRLLRGGEGGGSAWCVRYDLDVVELSERDFFRF